MRLTKVADVSLILFSDLELGSQIQIKPLTAKTGQHPASSSPVKDGNDDGDGSAPRDTKAESDERGLTPLRFQKRD